MGDDQYQVLAGKIEGVARAFMLFITDQEERGHLDGVGYCRDLRQYAAARDRYPELQASAETMRKIAVELEQARSRRTAARHSEDRMG